MAIALIERSKWIFFFALDKKKRYSRRDYRIFLLEGP